MCSRFSLLIHKQQATESIKETSRISLNKSSIPNFGIVERENEWEIRDWMKFLHQKSQKQSTGDPRTWCNFFHPSIFEKNVIKIKQRVSERGRKSFTTRIMYSFFISNDTERRTHQKKLKMFSRNTQKSLLLLLDDSSTRKQQTNWVKGAQKANDKNGKNFKLNLAPFDKCFLFF